MSDLNTDFCVIGAGPAGLTLALLLLRSGARVTVVERTRAMDREYRGEILQPGGMALLGDLGVLGPARERGCYEHPRFQLVDRGRTVLDIDYRRLPGPHNMLLSIPQRHVLEELLLRCADFESFSYLESTRITELVRDGGRVRGAVVTGPAGRTTIEAHCVVGADGRYSKTRKLAGIENRRIDAFAYDVLWFKVPRAEPTDRVQISSHDGNPVLVYDSYPGRVQLGWTLPHRGYPAVAASGIEKIKAEICRAVPAYADAIDEAVTSLSDLTLLDVFGARAEKWADDGLLLIGDSAHAHSPVGAQGINLAIQDAALAHPVLLESLRAGDASAERLSAFPRRRGRDITVAMRIQLVQSKAMLSRSRIAAAVRPRAARVLARTPFFDMALRRIAYGASPVAIRDDLLQPRSPVDQREA